MKITNHIEMTREELDEAVKEYLSRRNITYNLYLIYYQFDHNGEIKRVSIQADAE